MTAISLFAPISRRLHDRAGIASIYTAMGRTLGEAARHDGNLRDRPCPVCGSRDVDPHPAIVGPVLAFHDCLGCGMRYAPRILREDVVGEVYRGTALRRAYWEHMRDDAAASPGQHEAMADALAALAPARGLAIDVGCGFGGLAAALGRRFASVIGLELDRATAAAGARMSGVPIRSQRLEELELPAGSVDLIVMNQILEHIDEPAPLIDAARRLLCPGGSLFVSVPHGGSLGLRVLGGRHLHVATHMHVNLFTAAPLRRLLEEHGLPAETIGTDDDPGLSLVEWLVERTLPPAIVAAPAFAVDKGLRWLAARAHLPSRLGQGARLDAVARKP